MSDAWLAFHVHPPEELPCADVIYTPDWGERMEGNYEEDYSKSVFHYAGCRDAFYIRYAGIR